MANFHRCKEIGKNGEEFLANLYANEWEKLDGKQGDLLTKEHALIPNPVKIEVKSDNHPKALAAFTSNTTPNEFHERYSNLDKQSPGGPWQALEHNCPVFMYFFTCGDVRLLSIYNTEKLITRLEDIIDSGKYKGHKVFNKTYLTWGFAIPRTELSDLHTTLDLTTPPESIIPYVAKLLE